MIAKAKSKSFQARPSPAKEKQSQSKKKALDFLGLASPKWAFSMGCSDPPRKSFFLGSFRRQWALVSE
jgi:hypothetical protein